MENFRHHLGLTTSLLTLQLAILFINPSCLAAKMSKPACTTYVDFVRASCRITKYPKLCYNSLASYAIKIHASQKALANTALSVTLSDLILASSKLDKLAKNKALRAAEVDALHDCIQKLKEAEENVRKCIGEIGSRNRSNFTIQMTNVKKWLNAVTAEVNLCRDAIVKSLVHRVAKAVAGHHVLHVLQVTSVTMELLGNYANAKHN